MAWTKAFGKGRVFDTALGHDEAIWKNDRFRQHLLGGLCDVLGLEMPAGEIAIANGGRSAPAASGIELLRAGDSVKGAAMWSFTTDDPGPRWAALDFDDLVLAPKPYGIRHPDHTRYPGCHTVEHTGHLAAQQIQRPRLRRKMN